MVAINWIFQVCTNGDISLGKPYKKYRPKPFPLSSDTTLICPFWADADPRYGGEVFSRITDNDTLLQRASREGRATINMQYIINSGPLDFAKPSRQPSGQNHAILRGIPGDGGYMVEGNPRRNLGCK